MKRIIKVALSIGACVFLLACDQKNSVDSTRKRAEAEGEAGKKIENENLAKKAEQMEKDLAERHYFYSTLEGEFQGTVKVNRETYNIKVIMARSIPPYTGDRIRQLSEIENDLNNLYFYIKIIQWHPDDESTSVSCPIFSGIKPNMMEGTLIVTSPECTNLYTLFLSENGKEPVNQKMSSSKGLAEKIRQRKIQEISYLTGAIQFSSNPNKYLFSAKKINQE